jgi:aspartate racemase
MEGTFYPAVFRRYGVEVVVPDSREISWIHERYIGQMLRGDFREETRDGVIGVVLRLGNDKRIDGVVLGGTELTILLSASSIGGVPALDTTALHVDAIVKRLLG